MWRNIGELAKYLIDCRQLSCEGCPLALLFLARVPLALPG